MKKILHYTTFSFLLVIGIASFNTASAITYTYICPDDPGHSVDSTVSIAPVGPFAAGNPTNFQANAQIQSTCTARKVNMTAHNNNLTPVTVIPDTTMNPGTRFPAIPVSTQFTSPSNAGSYKVTFQTGVEILAAADLCKNIPGDQTSYNADLTADPLIPGDCISVIRGTVWAGGQGGGGTTMNGHASFNWVVMKNLTITSVGGVATSVWPFSQPLVFHFAYCARWNPAYAAYPPSVLESSVQRYPIVGAHTQGECRSIPANFGYPNSGFNYSSQDLYWVTPSLLYSDGAYIAWDGVHQGLKPPYFPSAPGFFSAVDYKTTGTRTARGVGYEMYGISQKLNTTSNNFADIIFPLDKLVISKIEIPAGYKLILTNNDAQSPGTVVETLPFTNAAFVAYAPVQNVTRVNVYIPGGFGADLALNGKNPTDHLPNGSYQVSVSCSSGTPSAIPSSFTLPSSGIVAIKAKCQ